MSTQPNAMLAQLHQELCLLSAKDSEQLKSLLNNIKDLVAQSDPTSLPVIAAWVANYGNAPIANVVSAEEIADFRAMLSRIRSAITQSIAAAPLGYKLAMTLPTCAHNPVDELPF